MPSEGFAELGASSVVVSTLADRGIAAPFAVQRLVVPDVLAGRDVLVKSPTGSGKTLAFAVPLVDRIEASDPRPSALVLVPTRELAGQIEEEIRPLAHARALSVAAVYGGAGIERQRKLVRRAHIVVATPGRLEDLIARGALSLANVRTLVLDEADRMLDMGFRPPVDRIVAQLPRRRQTLFFSATLEGEVNRVARAYTTDARTHENAPAQERRGDVSHRFVSVTHDSRFDTLVGELRGEGRGLTLVFVRTKRGADRLVKRLRARDIEVAAMHGDKSQSQRQKALASFESGRVDTLVATDVAARGLDVDDVTHVITSTHPRTARATSIGWGARAGRGARASASPSSVPTRYPTSTGSPPGWSCMASSRGRVSSGLGLPRGMGAAVAGPRGEDGDGGWRLSAEAPPHPEAGARSRMKAATSSGESESMSRSA